MLGQQKIGQEKIGFESAIVGLIDQGRQRVITGQYQSEDNHWPPVQPSITNL